MGVMTEKRETAIKEIENKLRAAHVTLGIELKKRGHKPTDVRSHYNGYRTVDGESVHIEIDTQRTHSSWEYPKKIQIFVGLYGPGRKRFPERKDGFDFKAIIDYVELSLAGIQNDRTARNDKEQRLATWRAAVDRLNAEVGEPLRRVTLRVSSYGTGIDLDIEDLNEERARQILNAVREAYKL